MKPLVPPGLLKLFLCLVFFGLNVSLWWSDKCMHTPSSLHNLYQKNRLPLESTDVLRVHEFFWGCLFFVIFLIYEHLRISQDFFSLDSNFVIICCDWRHTSYSRLDNFAFWFWRGRLLGVLVNFDFLLSLLDDFLDFLRCVRSIVWGCDSLMISFILSSAAGGMSHNA